jgi:NAD(P)-dependent dehydrogenase (short-subunit alcohol dehydrogenase family)
MMHTCGVIARTIVRQYSHRQTPTNPVPSSTYPSTADTHTHTYFSVFTTATVTVVSSSMLGMSYPHVMAVTKEEVNDQAIYDHTKAYGQSKLANLYFGQEFAVREMDNRVYCNIIHPGMVATNLSHLLKEYVTGFGVPASWYQFGFDLHKYFVFDPKTAALTQLYTAVSPEIVDKQITGKLFFPIADEVDAMSVQPAATNVSLQQGLWAFTDSYLHEQGFQDY